jgi:GT2 family glycosyltransferase
MVTSNPGAWFEEALASLGAQTYPNLSVLVVDAASEEDPTPRVARVLPSAYVRRLETNPGFGAAANEVLSVVEGAAFFCFCHDDVALDPSAIRVLVEEAFRSNAGVVGPKLVSWDDPQVLRQVGLGVDKFGTPAPYAEPGELDQEQHDAVRDVFAVPGGCTLVRSDLFEVLEGFDPGIDLYGEDIDLCWRAHLAGARVMVVPSARARHREALPTRRPDVVPYHAQELHRVRTLLSCYRVGSLLRVLPQALLLSLLEIVWSVANHMPERARSQVVAWTSALRHPGELRRRRRRIAATRNLPDRELRRLQSRGSARLSAVVRGQAEDPLRALARQRRRAKEEAVTGAGARRGAVLAIGLVIVVLVVGSRQLLFGSIPQVGDFAGFHTNPLTLLGRWWNGWRDAGLGSPGATPAGLGALSGAGIVFIGAMGQLRKVLILGLLPLGGWGAWLLARPLGTRRSRIAALLVYAAIPVPYNAIAGGSWSGLVLFAAAPWILLALARAMAIEPFGATPSTRADTAGVPARGGRRQPALRLIVSLGLTLALAALLVPFVVVVVGIVTVALIIGSLVTLRTRGFPRLLAVAAGAVVVAAVLHLPWTLGLLRSGAQWAPFAGSRAGVGGWLSVGHLLRFESGPFGAAPLGWAFLATAALPLIIGRGWRFEWAVRAWFVALACWAAVWTGQQGWLPVALPPVEVLLAPAAAALALASALGMAAFELDLPGYRFGWRQGLSVLAAAAVLVGALPMLGGAFGGRWKMPGQGFDSSLAFLQGQWAQSPYRVLWVGDPATLPVASWRFDDRLAYGTSNRGLPSAADQFPVTDPGKSVLLAEAVQMAMAGRTTHLGHLLAVMDVRYLVVPRQTVPDPYARLVHPPPPALDAALTEQVDLSPQTSLGSGVTVYENTAWAPQPRLFPPGTRLGTTLAGAAGFDAGAGDSVLSRPWDHVGRIGSVPRPGVVFAPVAADEGWHLRVGGHEADSSTAFGWAEQFSVPNGGRATLSYTPPIWDRLLLVLQGLLWVGALVAWRRTHRSRTQRKRDVEEVTVL